MDALEREKRAAVLLRARDGLIDAAARLLEREWDPATTPTRLQAARAAFNTARAVYREAARDFQG